MGDIVKSLKYLEFPECTKQALKFLATSLSCPSSGDGKYIADVCQDYILFRKSSHKKQLNPIQELQLLELLCDFLENIHFDVRTAAFAFIFGGRVTGAKVDLLTKLVSLGISVQSKPVLDSVADWMQGHGFDSSHVLNVSRSLVQDHCVLFPDTNSAFSSLPTISPLLACNIMCSVTSLYTYHDKSSVPPELLVQYVTQWISSDPSLCASSIVTFSTPQMITESSDTHCPLVGLLKWCVLGPMVEVQTDCMNSSNNNIFSLFSQLHLAILHTLLNFSHEHCQLLTINSIETLISQFWGVCKKQKLDEDLIQFAVERLAQAVQVALSTNNLRCPPKSLCNVLTTLPPNRLVQIVLRQLNLQCETPMDM